jgi:hypothetical protein
LFILSTTIVYDVHKSILKNPSTLFIDLYARAVSSIDFTPANETSKLLSFLSMSTPTSRQEKASGLISCLENLCMKMYLRESPLNCCAGLPRIQEQMPILPAIRKAQPETRTVKMDLRRIAGTRRLKQESIDFLQKA